MKNIRLPGTVPAQENLFSVSPSLVGHLHGVQEQQQFKSAHADHFVYFGKIRHSKLSYPLFISMDKQILEPLVKEGLSSYQIAERLNCSQNTALRWIKRCGLVTFRPHKCYKCGEVDISKFSPGRFSECRKCRIQMQVTRYRRYKVELVIYKGGKCEICGYNKCMAGLTFHHINPEGKDPNWKLMRSWSPARVKKEIDKCQLLCRNCHSEIHYGKEELSVDS